MGKIGLNYYIDVSGQPYSTVIPALVSVKTVDINQIEKDLRNKFFQGRTLQKGKSLKENELKNVLSFLDSNGVRMYTIGFTSSDWQKYRSSYGQRAHFKEKIMAALYMMLLSQPSKRFYRYHVNICVESWMHLEVTLSHLRNLSKANKYLFDISPTRQKYCSTIRFADYVAAGARKISHTELSQLQNFHFVGCKIPPRYIKKLFIKR